MTYEKDTRNAYRNEVKANAYKNQYIQGAKWARFTMWKQKRIITKFLDACNLESDHTVLDIPCGTGYIGSVLAKYEASVIASDISEEMMDYFGVPKDYIPSEVMQRVLEIKTLDEQQADEEQGES